MRILRLATLGAVWAQLAVNAQAAIVYFRSVPDEGEWAEWSIESSITSEGVQPKVRLTAGKAFERDGHRCQLVDLSGTWEDDGKAVPIGARYEVDLEKLKKTGSPSGSARLLAGQKKGSQKLEPLEKDDLYSLVYQYMLMSLQPATLSEKAVKLDEPRDLARYELHVLAARADTKHFGEGEAPTSRFKAWVGEEVPFGVAKWELTTQMVSGRDRVTITMVATLTASGKAADESEGRQDGEDRQEPKAANGKSQSTKDAGEQVERKND